MHIGVVIRDIIFSRYISWNFPTPMGLFFKLMKHIIINMKNKKLQVVVETPEFIKQAQLCMDQDSKDSFVDFIAKNPCIGDIIPGTGGARKVRWASNANQGKSGGARVIYYYYNPDMPVFSFYRLWKKSKSKFIDERKKCT